MEAVDIGDSKVLWVITFGFTAAGESQDYQIEEIGLADKSAKTIRLLNEKIGEGVFTSYEAALQWLSVKSKHRGCCGCSPSEACKVSKDRGE